SAALAAYKRAITLRDEIKQHDLLWIEKELLPWLPFWLERGVLRDTPYILDFDDAWALRYAESNSPLVRMLLRNKFGKLLRGAELTIVANDTLYRWALSEGARNILLLPTVIDLARYQPPPPPSGPFTVCWIGTPLNATYLESIAEPLRALSREQQFKLLVVGAPEFTLPGVDVEGVAWTEATEASLIGRCHAGIMPLPDTNWANGKSGYKLIQYMAMARPAIASAVGANGRIVVHGETGFLAYDAEDWITHLRTLRENPGLCATLGAAARRRVEQNYSLGVTAPILLDTITELLGNIAARKAGRHFAAPVR
ncbi:MAG: glycosyltransferase, partial [Rhodospirillales bacterium]|nr:glycosyltransferase [Rhodospirillales bacterium]